MYGLTAPPAHSEKSPFFRRTPVLQLFCICPLDFAPYSRTCPIKHSTNIGRISKGDVVFLSRFSVVDSHIGHREEHIVGIDYLNKALGNDPRGKPAAAAIHPNWVVGKTVVLGGSHNMCDDPVDRSTGFSRHPKIQ
jgi:hypothetical protein